MRKTDLFFLTIVTALLFLGSCTTAVPLAPTVAPTIASSTETPSPTETLLPTDEPKRTETATTTETVTPMPTEAPVPTEIPLPTEPGIYGRFLPDSDEASYTLSLPNGYDPTVAYPLVVSLHYAGYNGPGFGAGLLQAAMISGFKALNPIIVAPDSPNWRNEAGEKTAIEITNFILENYVIDRERVVLSGYSNGGAGTWLIAANNQDIFTAAMPMAAPAMSNAVSFDWQIPILVLNSKADELFDFDSAERTANQLKEMGVNLEFYAVEEVSHYRADLYAGPMQDALPWLLTQWED